MKVVQIVPGSGGTFYCQNCMRESAQVKAVREKGHDVIMVPMYLPMFTDEPDISGDVPVFFGGINVYLQEKVGLFRRTPRWVDKLFDAPWLLNLAAKMSGSTQSNELWEMTLSMLKGEEGNQVKEIERLVTWLRDREKPDVIHIASILLIGLVRPLKQALGAPVVCAAQDEDTWIDAIEEPHRERCWDAIRERAADVDAFVSVSRYYSDLVARRLRLPPERMQTVYPGIDTSGYEPAPAPPDPPVLGFLSRLKESVGLGILLDAFLELKEDPRFRGLRLRATGGTVGRDKDYVAHLRRRLRRKGCEPDVDFLPDFDRPARIEFLKTLSVMSVPVPGGEAFGSYILESLAAGVPVVQPRAGAFPEIIERTGGGITYEPNDSRTLAAALRELLGDPARARELGRRGRDAVLRDFGIGRAADDMLRLYESVRNRRPSA